MPTMTVTITDVPSFAAVKEGYGFTGKMSLPQVVDGAIKINSMKLYYGYVRRYVRYVFLRAVCGDTTFNTEYFSLQPDETLKEITKVCTDIVEGTDHLLRQNGRTISFTVACDYSTSSNVVARPRGGNMTLTVDYTILQSGLTLDKDSVDAGQPIRATITAGDAAYTHKLTFTAGSRTETIELLAGVGSADYTIPLEWLEEIPRATELQATATLDTYSGDTLMGSEEKTFTIKCPANVLPTCQVTAEPVNGFGGMYLSGRSSVKLAIVNAQGVYGSEVVGYQLTGAGYDQYLREATYGPLVQGERTFTASVTDTRGRVGKAQVTVTVTPYTAPSLANVSIYRSNGGGIADDEGAYIAVQATALFASTNDINTVTLQARYRTAGGAWGAWTDIVSGEQALLGGGALLATISYEAQVQVTDAVGNSASFMQRIPTSQVAFNLKEGGSAAAFGRYAERDKALSLPEDWRYYRGETDIEQKVDEALAKAEEALEKAEGGSGSGKYRIGDVHISFDPTSPASLYGGVWERLKDRFLLGAGDTYTAGDTGGSATHTLTVDEMPSHTHEVWGWKRAAKKDSSAAATVANNGDGAAVAYNRYESDQMTGTAGGCTSPVVERGGGQAHSIMPPYLTVYMWRRTA